MKARAPIPIHASLFCSFLVMAAACLLPLPTVGAQGDPDTMIIGISQRGRPIVVNWVGTGSTPVLILGGQHGGPEANTVRLAEQLLSYFQASQGEIPSNVRLESVAGMIGTSSTSAASNTLSLTSDTLGGQSRNVQS